LSAQLIAANQNIASGVFSGFVSAPRSGTILSLGFIANAAAAAGESMVITVTKEGQTLGTFTYDSTKAARVLHPVTLQLTSVAAGDVFFVGRVYTAGGTPTPIGTNTIELVWEIT
jgi:hypothetical protein